MESQIIGILGVNAVDLIFTSRITFRFEIIIKWLYGRLMHKQRVTELGSLRLYLS